MNDGSLRGWLVERVAELSGIPSTAIDANEPFASYGLDSVKLAALAAEIESHVGRRLQANTLFEHPTVGALAAYLSSPSASRTLNGDRAGADAIAIVGLACRLPGADDGESFWRLLAAGGDAISDVPADRWDASELYDSDPSARGRTVSRWGGFITGVAEFDAPFFRISAAEATQMDPQQRLLLQVSWEALEDAGEIPARLRGSATGVYIGISNSEYFGRQLADLSAITPQSVTGNALSVAANRLSYVFDLRGPSISVDTACSSSLVAVHLACRALRTGECDRALVGGVNLLLDPELTIALSRAGMLSPDGRCKTFDASANGYVRSEGCGVVVLKPMRAALAAGDRIYAIIRGTAINQDGASNGLTAPNPAAQREVVRAACRDATIDSACVEYVECHGTGTLLGDPIEAEALGAVIGSHRPPGEPCLIGSVKTNLGHLEAAAGITSLIKAALALHHGRIPRSLHFDRPNPHVDFTALGLKVVDRDTALIAASSPHVIGVSSFGFGGTNAHVVVQSPPPCGEKIARDLPIVLSVSARSAEALQRQLDSWAARVAVASPDEVRALAYTASVRRTHHRPFRSAIAVDAPEALAPRVRDMSRYIRSASESPYVAFAFGGQGAQWPAMGRRLLQESPLFASTIRRCDLALIDVLGWSVEAVLRGDDDRDVRVSSVAEPLIVAFEIALADLWRSLGIEPAVVIGHSLGEISAAICAGVFDLETGLQMAARRGKLMHENAEPGRMLAVGLDRSGSTRLCERFSGQVSVGAANGPRSTVTVLSGEAEVLELIRLELDAEGVFARLLPVPYAFHSHAMQRAAAAFSAELADLVGHTSRIPIVSTVHGREVGGAEMDAAYWGNGVRRTVEFEAGVNALLARGVGAIIEISPQPVLRRSLRQIVQSRECAPAVLHSAERERGGLRTVLDAACQLYALGCDVRWERAFPEAGTVSSVPRHSWERRAYWTERFAHGRKPIQRDCGLLGTRLELAYDSQRLVWERALDGLDWLGDHQLDGTVVLPAAAFAILATDAVTSAGLGVDFDVTNLVLHVPVLPFEAGATLQTMLNATGDDTYVLSIYGRSDKSREWTLHATGRVERSANRLTEAPDASAAELRCTVPVVTESFYRLLAEGGLTYGPSLRGVKSLWRGEDEAFAIIDVGGEGTFGDGEDVRALDCALQAIAAVVGVHRGGGQRLLIPSAFTLIRSHARLKAVAKAHVRVRELTPSQLVADITVFEAGGRPCVEIAGLELRGMPERTSGTLGTLHLYETRWRERPSPAAATVPAAGAWLVIENRAETGDSLHARLRRHGVQTVAASAGFDPAEASHYTSLIEELTSQPRGLAGVVHALSCGPPEAYAAERDPARLMTPAISLLHLVRALSAAPGTILPQLVVVSSGQSKRGVCAALDQVVQATTWGLLKALPIENPLLRFSCVDLALDEQDSTAQLASEILAGMPDTEVSYRGEKRFVPRLVNTDEAANRRQTRALVRLDGTYVVTGGTGGLGLLFARHLAERGARRIGLFSRAGETPDVRSALSALRRAGTDVRVVRADVRDRGVLRDALAAVRSPGAPIRGLIHAAGVLDDGALLGMTTDSLRTVVEPKLLGGWNLHELTQNDPLDWFVLFSSAAGMLGSPGQANYSAANAALDALARARRRLGLPALSILWGPWSELGMTAGRESGELRKLRTGASAIDPDEGLAMFERLVREDRVETVVLPFDLRDLLQFHPAGPRLSFFEELVRDAHSLPGAATHASTRPDLASEYVAPRNGIERRIVSIWQRALAIEPIGVFDSFFELGGDSVFGNQILIEINRTLGIKIDPERAFTKLTIAHLAALAEEHAVAELALMTESEALEKLEALKAPAKLAYAHR